MINFKKINIYSVILISLLFNGCNLQDFSDGIEYDDYNDTTITTLTNVNVISGTPILGAFVVDVNDKIAVELTNGTYQFTGHIRYPLRAYGGFNDTNLDGVIDINDISNNIVLRTNSGTNLTLLTTYMSAPPNTDNSDPTVINMTDADAQALTGVATVSDLYVLPYYNLNVAAFSHAIFKVAQNNMVSTGTTELNSIINTDFQVDMNNILTNYQNSNTAGITIYNVNKDGWNNMFTNGELDVNNTYIFYPSGPVDLTNTTLVGQTPFFIRYTNSVGTSAIDQPVTNDSFASIGLYLEAYGRIKMQIDVMNEAIVKYGYPEYTVARNENILALGEIKSLIDFYGFMTNPTLAYKNYTLPILSNGYNDIDIQNWYNGYITSLNNDNDLDFSINVTRYEYEFSLPFFKFMMMRYQPDIQYTFRRIYKNLANSRDALAELSNRL
jgi:hypothetical protein